MKIEHISYILTIVSLKSVNKASVKLNYSTQALCNILTGIENEFDTQFFIRDRQGISLTQAGEIFIESLKKINDIIEKTKADLQEYKNLEYQEFEGTIYLYYVTLVDESFIVDVVNAFLEKYPKINLQIQNCSSKDVVMQVRDHPDSIGIFVMDKFVDKELLKFINKTEELVTCAIFKCVPMVVYKKGSSFINSKNKKIMLESLKEIPYLGYSENKLNIFGAEDSKINNVDLYFKKLELGNCYSILGINDLNRNSFLEKHPKLDMKPICKVPYFDTTFVYNRQMLNHTNKLFIDFLFEYRDKWFYENGKNMNADYFVFDKIDTKNL